MIVSQDFIPIISRVVPRVVAMSVSCLLGVCLIIGPIYCIWSEGFCCSLISQTFLPGYFTESRSNNADILGKIWGVRFYRKE